MTRRGLTLVELLVALVLTGVIMAAAGRVLVQHLRTLEELTVRTEVEEAGRTAFHLLSTELRAGRPGADWGGGVDGDPDSDVLRLRSFQGFGRVCDWEASDGEVTVAHEGWVTLESERDSVLVLPREGEWQAVGVERVGPAADGCPLGGVPPGAAMEEEVWRLDPFVDEPLLVRPFRHTVYHLADDALRVEQGGAGRQPLTPERLGDGTFEGAAGSLGVDLRWSVGPGAEDRRETWRFRGASLASGGDVGEGP